jgi:NAD(P)-dependent dehydrogenase (short-subunit alcohol dehydrogenase family)
MSFRGKVALVTGAAKRLGRATALALAEAGADVVVHYGRSKGEAEDVRKEILAVGRRAWLLSANLASEKEAIRLVDQTFRIAGRLDILVNNASIFPSNRLPSLTFAELRASLEVNAWAPFVLARRFVEKARGGHVVNFLDARISGANPEHAAYQLSKELLASLTRMMAVEFAPRFAVNAVAPGPILLPKGKGAAYLKTLRKRTLLKRIGTPADVADAVVYLTSSRYITGQVLFVDGGWQVSAT